MKDFKEPTLEHLTFDALDIIVTSTPVGPEPNGSIEIAHDQFNTGDGGLLGGDLWVI